VTDWPRLKSARQIVEEGLFPVPGETKTTALRSGDAPMSVERAHKLAMAMAMKGKTEKRRGRRVKSPAERAKEMRERVK
jgi:hypothetical protein